MSMVYLLTFCCYGSRVPGEEGVVSRSNNLVGARRSPASEALAGTARESMTDAPYDLGPEQRRIVLQTAIDVCRHRGWILKAAHVRTTHVHLVVEAEIAQERIMNSVKSYSSRALKRHKSWARHGSTLYLWTREEVARAIRYAVSGQGAPMAMYTPNPDRQEGDII